MREFSSECEELTAILLIITAVSLPVTVQHFVYTEAVVAEEAAS